MNVILIGIFIEEFVYNFDGGEVRFCRRRRDARVRVFFFVFGCLICCCVFVVVIMYNDDVVMR